MPFVQCSEIVGNTALLEAAPMIATYSDVLYVPRGFEGFQAGMYDRGRKLVTHSANFLGVPHIHPRERYITTLDPEEFSFADPRYQYFFIGRLFHHYGHFIIGSLARLWALQLGRRENVKFVVLDRGAPTSHFVVPYIRQIFAELDIGSGDMISFDKPTRFRSIVIPEPAIEELNCVHRDFAHLCNKIGRIATNNIPPCPNDSPIYLSKANLTAGVTRLVNEMDFCDALMRHGVKVVFPSELTVRDQILLFRDRPNLSALVGSALHTSIFVPRRRLLVLNYTNRVSSTQILIDRSNQNETRYIWPEGDIVRETATREFSNNFRLIDPVRTASEFLIEIDRFNDRDSASSTAGYKTTGLPPSQYQKVDLPYGALLSLGKPANQSSVSKWSRKPTTFEDAAGAVSGKTTGRYQFHTAAEQQPWWQVDLLALCRIRGARIYNRLDGAPERSAHFRLLVSADCETWSEVFRRETGEPYGGLDGDPFVWTAKEEIIARYFRIALLGRSILHLDQVEVFGDVLP